jgi:tetratricopeptide (TPR) repeat protein
MRRPRPELLICLFLIVSTVAAYWQVWNHDFVYYDDHLYVTENPDVQEGLSWEGLLWALTTTRAANWHPLTWLSHMLDSQVFGLNPGWHHLSSLLLHLVNTLLLFVVLRRMTNAVWPSAFVAALFALHPLHVESVAWVAERKDVLSTFFWMTTMWAYVRYVESPVIGRYLLVLLFFALGLAAKPMLVTLPFVLLLMDYWPLRRFQFASGGRQQSLQKSINLSYPASVPLHLVREKVPFLALAAVSSVVTLVAQQASGAIRSLDSIPFQARLANALVAYVSYIGKMIWPAHLAVLYPLSGMRPMWQAVGAGLFLACVFAFVLRSARKRPYLAVGWLWYFVTLIPVIGLVQVGSQAMADRYTYVPLIGLFIIIAWGVSELTATRPYQRLFLVTSAGIVLSALGICTQLQLRHWDNDIVLFKHAVDVTANNYIAHDNLGSQLSKQERFNEAISHFSESLRIKPGQPLVHYNLGNALAKQGKLNEAIQHYSEALRIDPNSADTHNGLGAALYRQGKIEEAITHYSEALRIDPSRANTHNNLGMALAAQGKLEEAIAHYSQALRLDTKRANTHNNLGAVFYQQGKLEEAIVQYSEALRIDPHYSPARENLSAALRQRSEQKENGLNAP